MRRPGARADRRFDGRPGRAEFEEGQRVVPGRCRTSAPPVSPGPAVMSRRWWDRPTPARHCGSGPTAARRSGPPTAAVSRPSWALDDAVWVVVDGSSVMRVIRGGVRPARPHPGGLRRGDVEVPGRDHRTAGLPGRDPGVDGDRRSGRAGRVEQTPGGEFSLTYPRRLGFGLGNSVVSLSGAPATTWWSPAVTPPIRCPTSASTG